MKVDDAPPHEETSQDLQAKALWRLVSKIMPTLMGFIAVSVLGAAWVTYQGVTEHDRLIVSITAKQAELGTKVESIEEAQRQSDLRDLGTESRIMGAIEKTDRKVEILCARLGKPCKE